MEVESCSREWWSVLERRGRWLGVVESGGVC